MRRQRHWRGACAVGFGLATWIVASGLVSLTERLRQAPAGTRWRRLGGSAGGMLLAHAGVAVFVVGVTGVRHLHSEHDLRMAIGDEARVGGHVFRLESLGQRAGPNYIALGATLTVSRDGEVVAVLRPERRQYVSSRMPMTEVLAVHQPSGTWAAYAAVGDGSSSFASIIAGTGDSYCWRDGNGYEMSAGSLVSTGGLCDTDLYLNAADHDGGGGSCTCDGCVSDAHGPTWNVDAGDGCPFDGAGAAGGMGPDSDSSGESTAAGFGAILGLNTGVAGAGENRIEIYVR